MEKLYTGKAIHRCDVSGLNATIDGQVYRMEDDGIEQYKATWSFKDGETTRYLTFCPYCGVKLSANLTVKWR